MLTEHKTQYLASGFLVPHLLAIHIFNVFYIDLYTILV